MRQLEQLPTEDMREVLRIATELYQRDQGQMEVAREREGLIAAAAEVDLPAEYLERAAATLHTQRVAAIRTRRRRRNGVLAVAGLTGGVGLGWQLMHLPPPAPLLYNFNNPPAHQWTLGKNDETRAQLAFPQEPNRDGVASLTVERFGARGPDGTYNANINSSDVPPSLAGFRKVTFFARTEGLPHLRLYLENGPNERWRSPELTLTGEWQPQALELRQFERQTRASPSAPWQRASSRAPGKIETLSFKVGHFVNDVSARGKVLVDDLRFE